MPNSKKELVVSAIENGTVIDHIPSGMLFKVVQILNLASLPNQMTLGCNLDSQRLGSKGIIKIANKFFEPHEINLVTLVAPHAKINVIRDYQVVKKIDLSMPETISGLVKCVNPKCITNHEAVTTRFDVVGTEPTSLRCHYCGKITDQDHMEYNR